MANISAYSLMDFFNRIFKNWSSRQEEPQREHPQEYRTAARQINDSVYELHKPNGVPSMQVLFFHGFQWKGLTDVHLSTWKTADGSHLWPETWLVEEFPDAHVLCVKYDNRMLSSSGQDLYLLGEFLLSDTISLKIGQIPHCPVILVGHAFGGLVIKQVCLMADNTRLSNGYPNPENVNFLTNVKAAVFYSTPHLGFSISLDIRRLCNISESLAVAADPLSREGSRLHYQFRKLSTYYKWLLVGLGETESSKMQGLFGSFQIVDEASARYNMDHFNLVPADHFSICTPDSKSSISFQYLRRHLQEILDKAIMEKESVNGEHGTWKQVGQLFVNDKNENVLGYGSSGTVVFEGVFVRTLEARQEKVILPRPIKLAVKRLVTAYFKKAQKEIDLLVTITAHQNVVRYYWIEQTDEFIYLGLERCSCSLDELICAQSSKVASMEGEQKKRLSEKGLKLRTEEDWKLWDEDKQPSSKLLNVLIGIVKGLVHLHSQRIAHRDLKPSNILLTILGEEMEAKIADMGLSKQWGDTPKPSESTSHGHSGTRGWRAPEQLGTEKLDEGSSQAADVFCLGCVLFYCITEGEHPFGDEREREINIKSGHMNLSQGGRKISAEAENLVKSLLHPVAADRPLARSILNHPFFWNPEKRLSFLMDTSDRLEGDRKEFRAPKFVAEVESRRSEIQCSGWDSQVDPRLTIVTKRSAYNYSLVRDLLRLIRNRAHHFQDIKDSEDVLTSKPEGIVKYFAGKFPRLLMEIYDAVGKHYRADPFFQKYYLVDI